MTNETKLTNLPLSDIKVDPACQTRVTTDATTITEYAEIMTEEGNVFPPVVIYYDGNDHWLSDGFHRYFAAKKAGVGSLKVEIRPGTHRDAILYGVGANATLRRTREDKRHAVCILLADEEWSEWSNRKIAHRCGVDEKLVRTLRSASAANPQIGRKVERNGKIYDMNTENIGKKDDLEELLSTQPDRDVQPDQRWFVGPDTGTAKEDGTPDKLGPVSDPISGTEEVHLQELLSAWSRASEEVQQQFRASIGVSPTPHVEAGSGVTETENAQEPEPSHEAAPPDQPSQAAAQGPKPLHDAGLHAAKLAASELVEMWNGYRGHTKTYGRNWVVAGCPEGALPGEHFTFTQKLEPFRAAVSAAPQEVRQHFLELTQAA